MVSLLKRTRSSAARRGARRTIEPANAPVEREVEAKPSRWRLSPPWRWFRRGAPHKRATPQAGQVRLALICAMFGGCVLVLVWRLYTFQVMDSSWYQQMAQQERDAEIPIVPTRGALLDTNGSPLAISVPYNSVYVLGNLVGNADKADKVAAALSPVLEVPADQLRANIDPKSDRPVVLKSAVPSAVAQQVQQLSLPGVYLDKEPVRQYPEGSLAAQILGFVGKDFSGLAGLELSYNQELAGTPGVIDTQKDTAGQEITPGRRLLTPPVQGSDLVLTLDRYVQREAERLLNQAVIDSKSSGGLILIMEPQTGNILAAANNPTYSLTADQIYDPQQAGLYKSKIVTDQYEPGSTLKPLTMSAAIDQGIVTPDTTFEDTGIATVGGATIHNWNGLGNGTSTMTQILIHSSNVGMTWVSGQLAAKSPDLEYDYLQRYGLGQLTGLRLPGEVPGTMRTNKDPGLDGRRPGYQRVRPGHRRDTGAAAGGNLGLRQRWEDGSTTAGACDSRTEWRAGPAAGGGAWPDSLAADGADADSDDGRRGRAAGADSGPRAWVQDRGQDGDGGHTDECGLQHRVDDWIAGLAVSRGLAEVRGADQIGWAGETVRWARGGARAQRPRAGAADVLPCAADAVAGRIAVGSRPKGTLRGSKGAAPPLKSPAGPPPPGSLSERSPRLKSPAAAPPPGSLSEWPRLKSPAVAPPPWSLFEWSSPRQSLAPPGSFPAWTLHSKIRVAPQQSLPEFTSPVQSCAERPTRTVLAWTGLL